MLFILVRPRWKQRFDLSIARFDSWQGSVDKRLIIPFSTRNYAIKGGNPRVSKGVRKCALRPC